MMLARASGRVNYSYSVRVIRLLIFLRLFLFILAAWAAGRELEVLGTSTRVLVLDLSRVFF